MKNIYLFFLIFFTLSLSLKAEIIKINDTEGDGEPIRTITIAKAENFSLNYAFSTFSHSFTEEKGEDYSQLYVKNFSRFLKLGKPALPAHTDIVAVPKGCKPQIVISDINWIPCGTMNIWPAQAPEVDTYGLPKPPFAKDEDCYSTDAFWPNKAVTFDEILTYRGTDMALITICPFRYNPVSGQLEMAEKISYSLNYDGKSKYLTAKHSENSLTLLNNLVLNAKSFADEAKSLRANISENKSDDDVDYIVLTTTTYSEAAHKLAGWKSQIGFNPMVVELPFWTSEIVEDTITALYNSFDPAPDYFVIFGDHGDIPAVEKISQASDEVFPTDSYYAGCDYPGDYFPDMAHGRITISTPAQAIDVVNKIISYEADAIEDEDFYKSALHCAYFQDDDHDGYADRRFSLTAEESYQYLKNSQNLEPERIYCTSNSTTPTNWNNGYYAGGEPLEPELLKPTFPWNGNTNDIIQGINNGAFFVLHRDHGYGSGVGWADPKFVTSDVESLQNGNKQPVVLSINCSTGRYNLDCCFCEKLFRHEDGGSIAIFCHSNVSYSGYNDALGLGLIDAIWSDPGLLPTYLGEGWISNPNVTPHEEITTLGDVQIQALARMVETWGNNKYTFELFHYFGDPSMKIWKEKPEPIVASHPEQINADEATSINIWDCNIDGLATLVIKNKSVGDTDISGGIGEITFDQIEPCDTIILTISKKGYQPYVAKIPVVGKPFANFSASTFSTCSGDVVFTDHSILNPETWSWEFGDGTTSEEQNPIHRYSTNGTFSPKLTITNSYGSSEYSSEPIEVILPEILQAINDTVCTNQDAILVVEDEGTVRWFETETETIPFAEGAELVLENITETTTVFAELNSATNIFFSKSDNSGGGQFAKSAGGVVFNCYQPTLVKSIKVYAEEEGDATLELYDNGNAQIWTETFSIPAGESRIPINYTFPIGDNFKLYYSDGPKLYMNKSLIDYPFVLENYIEIITSTFTPDPNMRYFYLYDWEAVANICYSTKTALSAIVEEGLTVDFTADNTTDPEVSFTCNTIGATSYLWDFGDGESSTDANPTHLYEENGTFEVSLQLTNECGDFTSTQDVEIKTHSIEASILPSSILLMPNPANNIVNLHCKSKISGEARVNLISTFGKYVKQTTWNIQTGENQLTLKLEDIAKGVYLVEIVISDKKITQRLIIQ